MRDTDADWKRIGEEEPYWGVLTEDRFLSERLNASAIADFYATGEADISQVVANLRLFAGPDFHPSRALDFGCGVGRLTFAMARHVDSVVGVDVSDGMLTRARDHAVRTGAGSAVFANQIPDGPFDWVNTAIALQHIHPERGMPIVERLLSALSPGGFLSMQLLTFREESEDLAEALSEPDPNFRMPMSMYLYSLDKVCKTLDRHGVETMILRKTDHGHGVGYWIFARREESALRVEPARRLDQMPLGELFSAVATKLRRRLRLL